MFKHLNVINDYNKYLYITAKDKTLLVNGTIFVCEMTGHLVEYKQCNENNHGYWLTQPYTEKYSNIQQERLDKKCYLPI